jgi:hypothetical protein
VLLLLRAVGAAGRAAAVPPRAVPRLLRGAAEPICCPECRAAAEEVLPAPRAISGVVDELPCRCLHCGKSGARGVIFTHECASQPLPYSCPFCTMDNVPLNRRCDNKRRANSAVVTRDMETARKEEETAVFRDPRLAEGGSLYRVADGAPLRYFNAYPNVPFVHVEPKKRYYPAQEKITPENPLYDYLCELEKSVPVAVARPPFTVDVRLIAIKDARFIRDRVDNEFQDVFVCSLFGRLLKTPNFVDFAQADTELHGPHGTLYNEGEKEQQRVDTGVTFPENYGLNLFFMRSDRSEYGGSFYVPVSKWIRPVNPLYADIQHQYDLRVRSGQSVHVFELRGWRFDRGADGHFQTVGCDVAFKQCANTRRRQQEERENKHTVAQT